METGTTPSANRSLWLWLGGAALLVLVLLFAIKTTAERRADIERSSNSSNRKQNEINAPPPSGPTKRYSSASSGSTPEQTVAAMVTHFGRSRREIARAMGRKVGKPVPEEIEKFFDAIEAGDWPETERLGKLLSRKSGQYDDGSEHDPAVDPFWSAVLDAWGVAEQAHMWPAQKLLDYGHAIVDSLRPGMVYVGGTDPGRWIPELLNESSEQPRIIVTQNAFADSRYLEFMNTVYGERMSALTEDDSKKAFAEYVADAQKRFEHDRDFPDEPKQVKPNENIKIIDGKTQVSGQVAVMAINEKLFQRMVEKNPDLSFAIEQSFPFKSTYANAAIMGPIMEVNAADGAKALTSESAANTVDYWKKATADLLAPDGLQDENLRKAYSKLASNQADLLSTRNFNSEAEQTYRMAIEMVPYSPEAVFGYANLLGNQSRLGEALPVVEKAVAADPKNEGFKTLLEQVRAKR